MDGLISVEHKVERSLYGAAPAMMKFMRKSHRSIKMLAARKMLASLVIETEVSKGWTNVMRSGDSISKREFQTLMSGLGETTALACVLRDVISYDGPTSMKRFFGRVTMHGIKFSRILEETTSNSLDFCFDLIREKEYACSIKMFRQGGSQEAQRLIQTVIDIDDNIVPMHGVNTLSDEDTPWSQGGIIEYLAKFEWKEKRDSDVNVEWRVIHKGIESVVITVRDRIMTLSKGKRFQDYFGLSGRDYSVWDRCLVTEGYTSSELYLTGKDDGITVENSSYGGDYCTIVSNMSVEHGKGLTGKMKFMKDIDSNIGIIDSVATLLGPVKSLKQLVRRISDAQHLHYIVSTRVMILIEYLLDKTRGFKVLTETIASMRELTGINQDFTYQYNMDMIRYEEIVNEVENLEEKVPKFSEEDKKRAESVMNQLRRQTDPTQELIMKEVMKSVTSGEIDYMVSSSSSIDRMWLDQFYGTDDERRIRLSKGKTCVVDAHDNYYVSIPSSKSIYIYYKDSGREIRETESEHQMFRSKSNLVTNRALVELCCVFKPSVTKQGSLTIDPYKVAKNRKRAESGLIYMLGQRCEDIAEDISRNKVIWDERKIKISEMRLKLIPEYLKEKFDREWFMREIVASYVKAGLRLSRESQYQCYARALGGIESGSGGLEFDIPMSLEGVEVRKIKQAGSEQDIIRSGAIELIETGHTWAGKMIYDSRATLGRGRVHGIIEKGTLSGFVGGSDHEFDSAALFRAVRKITFARGSETNGLLEVGSMEYKSVQYIKSLYTTDKTSVREIFSRLGYPSPEIIHKVVNCGKVDEKNSKEKKEVDRDRKLVVIANKICKMNAELSGLDPSEIEESGAIEYLEKNMEEHGTYVKFLAGLLELGDTGTVDEIMEDFREKRKNTAKQVVGESVARRDEQSETKKEECENGNSLEIEIADVTRTINRVFIMSEVIGSHPSLVMSNEEDKEKLTVKPDEIECIKPDAKERDRYNSEIREHIVTRVCDGHSVTEVDDKGIKKSDIVKNKTEKIKKADRKKKRNRGRRVCDIKKEGVERLININMKNIKRKMVYVGYARKRIRITLDDRARRMTRKIRVNGKGKDRQARHKKKKNKIKNLRRNSRDTRKESETGRRYWYRERISLRNDKKKLVRSCLREMIKTRRTHFKTKRRAG